MDLTTSLGGSYGEKGASVLKRQEVGYRAEAISCSELQGI
jgi:hypothetical protein